MFLKVLMHRIQVNGFDWFLDAVVGIVSRAAGSVAHIFEVGRPITGAGKTGGIYKGFFLGLSAAPEVVGFRSCADYNKESRARPALN
jgi:hypothetical protein